MISCCGSVTIKGNMLETLKAIAALQPEYSSSLTPAMRERGRLIRRVLPEQVRQRSSDLQAALEEFGTDFIVEASDGITRKTEAPWVRFASKRMSPNPRTGFYCVIHFSAGGEAFWVTVGCGSTIWGGGELRSLPDSELLSRTTWAQSVVDAASARSSFKDQIALGAKAKLPRTFEKATALAQRFDVAACSEEAVEASIVSAALALKAIYRAERTGQNLTAVGMAEIDLSALSRPNGNAGGQGYGLTAEERRAVELRAMAVSAAWLVEEGYVVSDRSRNSPFDFLASRSGQEIKVEVKGTTSKQCLEIFMTKNEFDLHRKEKGTTGLIVVSQISLSRDADGVPIATGGVMSAFVGWDVDRCKVQPIAYRVLLPQQVS